MLLCENMSDSNKSASSLLLRLVYALTAKIFRSECDEICDAIELKVDFRISFIDCVLYTEPFCGLVGGMDQKNKECSVFPDGMYTLDKPYFEAGAGIENIFKIIRIDAVWRLSYLEHLNTSPFGIRFSLQFNF